MTLDTLAKETLPLRPSRRSEAVRPFEVMEVVQAATELQKGTTRKVLRLEVGQPSAAPPELVTEAAIAALHLPPSQQGYICTAGLPALRCALSKHYRTRYNEDVSAEHILITTGSSGAFAALFASAFDALDRVAVAVPGYPCYRNVLGMLGVTVASLEVGPESNYQPTIEQLRTAHREGPLSGLIVASPANPTGAVLSAGQLGKLAEFCTEIGALLIADEIYHGVTRTTTATAVGLDHTVVVSSFSKLWCMPGFRVGWVVVRDKGLRTAMQRALQNLTICAPASAQYAAVAALDTRCEEQVRRYAQRCLDDAGRLAGVLDAAGFEEVVAPEGAFYIWGRCERVCQMMGVEDSVELCKALLQRAAVAVTPGVDFDPVRGGKYVRFSCAGATADIVEAGERISRVLKDVASPSVIDASL